MVSLKLSQISFSRSSEVTGGAAMTVTRTEHRPPARAAKPGCRRYTPTQPEFEVHLLCASSKTEDIEIEACFPAISKLNSVKSFVWVFIQGDSLYSTAWLASKISKIWICGTSVWAGSVVGPRRHCLFVFPKYLIFTVVRCLCWRSHWPALHLLQCGNGLTEPDATPSSGEG